MTMDRKNAERYAPSVAIDMREFLSEDDLRQALAADVRAGLTATPKELSPSWFYDDVGSELFDEITRLDEYYQTRAERSLLETHGAEIAARTGATVLAELGSGTCEKTRVILDAMDEAGTLSTIVPVDISGGTLATSVVELSEAYPGASVTGLVATFDQGIANLPAGDRRLVAFLGGTIGNFFPDARREFFTTLRQALTETDAFLLGCDTVKDPARLVAAYDDTRGVTAAFNRNMLSVLNHRLGAHFDPTAFDHVSRWDEENEWIEMRLRSKADQVVPISSLELSVSFKEGEDLRTEISAKFTPERIEAELVAADFVVDEIWSADGDFLLVLARPAPRVDARNG